MLMFRCEACGGRFPDNASEEELRAEFRATFPELGDADMQDAAQLCTRCYRQFMAWFRTLNEAQKREYREGYAMGKLVRSQGRRARGIQ